MTRLSRVLARLTLGLLLAGPTLHAQLSIMGSAPPILTVSGCTSSTTNLRATSTVSFTATGTCTLTTTAQVHVTFDSITAGGAGRPTTGGSGNGGGGGGSGARCAGVPVTLFPSKTYTLVIPAAATSSNAGGTLSLSDGTTTFISITGGLSGGQSITGAGGGTATTCLSGTGVSGVPGGTGSTEAVGGSTAGTADTSGAGGGGGGASGDLMAPGRSGGNGKDETGQVAQTDSASTGSAIGGHGGGMDFNGTKCGGGGGGGSGVPVGSNPGSNSEQGCAKLTVLSAP